MAWLNSGWLFPPCIGGPWGIFAICDGIVWCAVGGNWCPVSWLDVGWPKFIVCCCMVLALPEDKTVTCSLWAGWCVTVKAEGCPEDAWFIWCAGANWLFELIKLVCCEALAGRTLALSVFMIFCDGCWWAAGVCCWDEAWYLAFIGSPAVRDGTEGVCRVDCGWWDLNKWKHFNSLFYL